MMYTIQLRQHNWEEDAREAHREDAGHLRSSVIVTEFKR